MENEKLKLLIQSIVKEQLDSMSNLVVPFHTHNGWDGQQLVPATSLKGFPVEQVATASVAPTYTLENGQFIFRVDTTPTYYLWAYLSYSSGGAITNAWKGVQLS